MSEGEFVNVTPHRAEKKKPEDVDESTDTYDTIEWLVKTVPNNNGKAGLYGISYPGFYVAAGMPDTHPALKACSPQAPVTDLYMGDDAYHNGAFMLAANFGFYAFFKPRTGLEFPPKRWRDFDYGTNDGYDFYLAMGATSNAKRIYLKDANFYWDDQVQHTNYDEYWKARDISTHMKNVHCAVLTVGGLFDAEDLVGPYRIFNSVARMSPDTPNRLVEGPWVHGGWAGTKGDHLGPVSFAADNSAYFNDHVLLPFFRQHLKDAEDAKLPTALMFETGTNVWRRYDSWPPKNVQTRTLYFHGGGKLSFDRAAKDGAGGGYDEYVSDPARPVPFVETQSTGVPQTYMDADQRFAAKRPDVLVYETDALEEDLTVAGPVSPRLWVSTSGTDSDFVVKLIDVYPMDFPDAEPNPQEVRMGGYQQLVRGEPFRAKFRKSFEKPEPLKPNEPYFPARPPDHGANPKHMVSSGGSQSAEIRYYPGCQAGRLPESHRETISGGRARLDPDLASLVQRRKVNWPTRSQPSRHFAAADRSELWTGFYKNGAKRQGTSHDEASTKPMLRLIRRPLFDDPECCVRFRCRGISNPNIELFRFFDPRLPHGAPVGEFLWPQRKAYGLGLSRFECHTLKAF
jgi:hypothetical protein